MTLGGQDYSAFWTAPGAVAGTVTELLKRRTAAAGAYGLLVGSWSGTS
jgi:hypothetical protein